ncbi:23S rRNA accumulation protein YceD [Celerinatantimonas yamalensis]|uniref:Large ribosomal RNA subunit accumulation protein YceD n=1 Tax=Celerinatantimonas yamalensis TaxID=559956 RepID=A0ABW9G2Y1_9GAMM
MQKVKLPVEVEAFRAAKRRLDYHGILPKGQMLRLAQATSAVNIDANAWIRFDIDSQGLSVMTGTASTEVTLVCQRCREEFVLPLNVEFQYSPVTDKQPMEELPEAYEPLELDENSEFNLHEVLEDEFLIALPLIAMHSIDECKVQEQVQTFGKLATQEESTQSNPFAILQSLKKDN